MTLEPWVMTTEAVDHAEIGKNHWQGLATLRAMPRWENLPRTDGKGFTDPDRLPAVEFVFVDDVCGNDVSDSRWIKWSRAHTHPQRPYRGAEICIRPGAGPLTPSGLYTVCMLHEYAHVLTEGEGHSAVWEQVCREMGGRVGRHASRLRAALAVGDVWTAADFEGSPEASAK